MNSLHSNKRYFSKAAEFYRLKLKEHSEKRFSKDDEKEIDFLMFNDKPSYDEGRVCLTMNLPRYSLDSQILQTIDNR